MTRPARRGLVLVAAVLLLGLVACGDDPTADGADGAVTEISVAAASDLRFAFEELGAAYTAETGTEVTFTFGSSGQLREQIVNGAPFDLFASANTAFVDDVVDAGRGDPATRADYALGRLVLWAAPGVDLPGAVEDLADPRYRRIVIANPEHAPYGTAAAEALASAGISDAVGPRLVLGENISDAFRIARSGNADVAIVALSLVVTGDTPYTLLPEDRHEPLRQALVVTGDGARGEAAGGFADHLASPAGRAVMVRHGFVLPGETLPT